MPMLVDIIQTQTSSILDTESEQIIRELKRFKHLLLTIFPLFTSFELRYCEITPQVSSIFIKSRERKQTSTLGNCLHFTQFTLKLFLPRVPSNSYTES